MSQGGRCELRLLHFDVRERFPDGGACSGSYVRSAYPVGLMCTTRGANYDQCRYTVACLSAPRRSVRAAVRHQSHILRAQKSPRFIGGNRHGLLKTYGNLTPGRADVPLAVGCLGAAALYQGLADALSTSKTATGDLNLDP